MRKLDLRPLLRASLFYVVFAVLLVACTPYQFQGALIDSPTRAPEIVLTDQFGESFTLSEQVGKVNLIFFGYTHCPDVCPTTLIDYKYIHSGLMGDLEKVNFIFVSVDPQRDTVDQLTPYLASFHEDFIGLTGEPDQLKRAIVNYGVYVELQEPDERGEYLVDHTARIFVVDSSNNLRLTFPFGMNRDAMLADIQALLKEAEND